MKDLARFTIYIKKLLNKLHL
uniref:Uncharacterized protein n=1 Tax=Anguilla anguilla TaxID=7936 RepID=A0A0E9V8Z3_ANGAN